MTSKQTLPVTMLLLVCMQGVLCLVLPSQRWVNALALALGAMAALLASMRSANGKEDTARTKWLLAAYAFLLLMIGYFISSYRLSIAHITLNSASQQDLIFFLGGIPLLFAISMPCEDREGPVFTWIDAAEVVLAVSLACMVIFPSSFLFAAGSPTLSRANLAYAFDMENLLLVGVVTLRLIANPSAREKRFYLCVGSFLWPYALLTALMNHLLVPLKQVQPGSMIFVGMQAPFLLFVLSTTYLKEHGTGETDKRGPNAVDLCIGFGSPVFFTLAIVLLGAAILKGHLVAGAVSISAGVLLYGLRATILQMRYVETQKQLQGLMEKLEEVSKLDPLTGIPNRRSFDNSLMLAWNMARRSTQPLAMLMIDVDLFKDYNDAYGHQKGDECLVAVASTLRGHLQRSADLVARYGGEEFAVILPFTDLDGAQFVAQSLRQAIYQNSVPHVASPVGVLTISIGVASLSPVAGDRSDQLVAAADKALYRAKSNGRNRVELSRPSP
jgi:diguanylate cyclase (GGDEF)-like protein